MSAARSGAVRRGALGRFSVALLCAGVLAACSSIPDSGGVESGPAVDYDITAPDLSAVVDPPRTDATPQQIVNGFLVASTSSGASGNQARGYLAPVAAKEWLAGNAGVTIVASGSDVTGDGSQVTVTFTQEASIDTEGRYQELPEPQPYTATFDLVQVEDGQWRISGLADGLILPRVDVARLYAPTSIYFLDARASVLVPDLRMIPQDDLQATTLTNRLLAGPTSRLGNAVTSAFPAGTTLTALSVPVEDGVAQVDLSEAATGATPDQRELMAAQLTWTLGQLPEVFGGVRITVVGSDFTIRGRAGAVYAPEDWPTRDPDVLPAGTADAFVVRDGVLGRLEGGTVTPVDDEQAGDYAALDQTAISLDGGRIAGVDADGALVSGPLVGDDSLAVVGRRGLSSPSWSQGGELWLLDAQNNLAVVVAPEGDAVTIDLVGPAAGTVRALHVSRDGARVAAVVRVGTRETLQVGVVGRAADTGTPQTVLDFTYVALGGEIATIPDVAWADATSLAVLGGGSEGLAPLIQVVTIDGFASEEGASLAGAVALTAAPGSAVIAATSDGRLYSWFPARTQAWVELGAGSAPAYPG